MHNLIDLLHSGSSAAGRSCRGSEIRQFLVSRRLHVHARLKNVVQALGEGVGVFQVEAGCEQRRLEEKRRALYSLTHRNIIAAHSYTCGAAVAAERPAKGARPGPAALPLPGAAQRALVWAGAL